jgi:hypothetical protein
MPAQNLLLKLILVPLIIAAATLVARRWGERVSGLMIGLPLTSGPVSVFFAIEQSPHYAANAAIGSILGLVPVALFCASYVQAARRFRWYWAASLSIAIYLAAVWLMSLFTPNLLVESLAVPFILVLAYFSLGRMDSNDSILRSPWWDLPLRMVVATSLLVAITTAAGSLGPTWGGLLSPFPIFTFVMVTFSHSQGGAGAAWRLMRGVLVGLLAYTAFFIVVSLLVERASAWVVYPLATLVALAVNGFSLGLLVRRGHITQASSSDPSQRGA